MREVVGIEQETVGGFKEKEVESGLHSTSKLKEAEIDPSKPSHDMEMAQQEMGI